MRAIALFCLVLFTTIVSVAYADQVGDMDGDGQVGLKEAIISLQVAAGMIPNAQLGQYIQATGDAEAVDVLAGKTFSNDSAAGIDGTMANRGAVTITPTTSNTSIAQGYHDGNGSCEGDSDLLQGKILKGVTIFGVTGTATDLYESRYGDFTVYDHATDLLWQSSTVGPRGYWSEASGYCNNLQYPGSGSFTDWRLPTKEELKGLVRCSNGTPTPLPDETTCGDTYTSPTIDTRYFSIQGYPHWTSENAGGGIAAVTVNFQTGQEYTYQKGLSLDVLCVRP